MMDDIDTGPWAPFAPLIRGEISPETKARRAAQKAKDDARFLKIVIGTMFVIAVGLVCIGICIGAHWK